MDELQLRRLLTTIINDALQGPTFRDVTTDADGEKHVVFGVADGLSFQVTITAKPVNAG